MLYLASYAYGIRYNIMTSIRSSCLTNYSSAKAIKGILLSKQFVVIKHNLIPTLSNIQNDVEVGRDADRYTQYPRHLASNSEAPSVLAGRQQRSVAALEVHEPHLVGAASLTATTAADDDEYANVENESHSTNDLTTGSANAIGARTAFGRRTPGASTENGNSSEDSTSDDDGAGGVGRYVNTAAEIQKYKESIRLEKEKNRPRVTPKPKSGMPKPPTTSKSSKPGGGGDAAQSSTIDSTYGYRTDSARVDRANCARHSEPEIDDQDRRRPLPKPDLSRTNRSGTSPATLTAAGASDSDVTGTAESNVANNAVYVNSGVVASSPNLSNRTRKVPSPPPVANWRGAAGQTGTSRPARQ